MLRAILLFLSCLCCFMHVFGQQQDTVKRESVIRSNVSDNKANFYVTTPPLQQIPGAPKAFYDFYWEFGDGDYSLEQEPAHTYKKEGTYTVRLWTTNNYDNGKPPPSRPQKVEIKKITYDYQPVPAIPEAEGLNLKNTREPVPDEEMVVIVSYANESSYPVNGKLYVFFNEKKFKASNFALQEVRTHYGERTVPDEPVTVACLPAPNPFTLWAANEKSSYMIPVPSSKDTDRPLKEELEMDHMFYRDVHVLEFDAMAPGESRNVFFSLQTTPEMLKDTSAIVKIKGIYVPDRSSTNYKKKELEMEIVPSHDPNRMSVSDTRLNYRLFRNKTLDFKIRFQNNGEGPASSIKLNVDVSPMYDKQSLKILDVYPPCPICPDSIEVSYGCIDTVFTKDKIVFHFRNIYLPGSNQKNVEERDSTKGFVKYSLKFNPSVDKQRTTSRTAIIFDKNEPVITNYATTRFKPGLSLGGKAGYNYLPDLRKSQNFFAGVTISPYKSFRGYLQAELMAAYHTYTGADSTHSQTLTPIDGTQNNYYDLYQIAELAKYKNIALTAVPLSYRYNLNKYIGLGVGIQLSTNISSKTQQEGRAKYYLYNRQENMSQRNEKLDYVINDEQATSWFSTINTGLFGDLTLGSARIGPTLGARYIYNVNDPHTQYQFYALWKF